MRTLGLLVVLAVVACGKDKDGDTGGGGDLVYEDLGSHSLSDTGDYIEALAVEVPDGAVSSLVYCQGYGDRALGAIWGLQSPDGSVWDGGAPDHDAFRSDFLDDMSTGLLSITPRHPLSAGTYQVTWFVGAGNSGSARCGAVHRMDDVSARSTINVELVFVGAGGLDAATAEGDPAFQEVVAGFEAQWGTANLTPAISYRDFGGDLAKYSVVDVTDDDMSEFNDLLRTANPSDERTLTVFLVDEISNASEGGATILGLSAGPPGAAGLNRTSKSGVIVSAIDYADAPEDVAKILAHEGGHFLGLYHTTERDGGLADPLADTPVCGISNDADGNGTVNTSECAGNGAENVMWWTLSPEGTPSLSSNQSTVLRSNPLAD